jgi:ribonuclease III
VLNLLIAERLVERRQNETEGDLAPRLNRLVKKGACADAFRHLGLNAFILLSDGEVANGARDRESTLGDACEAVMAAVYLDGGLGAARKFLEKGWAPQLTGGPAETKDPKTLLQEWVQGQGHPLPEYVVRSRSGPDHAPVYEIEVRIAPGGTAVASGTSKRDAEREAAARMLEQLKGNS